MHITGFNGAASFELDANRSAKLTQGTDLILMIIISNLKYIRNKTILPLQLGLQR